MAEVLSGYHLPMNHTTFEEILDAGGKLSFEERRARVKACVAANRHDVTKLPTCSTPDGAGHYCEECLSIIDSDGLTWGRLPQTSAA